VGTATKGGENLLSHCLLAERHLKRNSTGGVYTGGHPRRGGEKVGVFRPIESSKSTILFLESRRWRGEQ